MFGNLHRVWVYGIEKIMISSVPDCAIQSSFSQVPETAFHPIEAREVDWVEHDCNHASWRIGD